MADFMAEWTETQQPPPVTQEHWSMYFDGSFTLNGAGGGIVLISPKGDHFLNVIRLYFCTTNNVVEYEALVNDLRIAVELGVNGFTSMVTLSSSSTKSWEIQNAVTPTWRHIDKRLGNWRRSSMVLSFIISSSETMRQSTPLHGSGLATNCSLQVCSCMTYSSLPSSLRKMA
jgi:ribonuclease HI